MIHRKGSVRPDSDLHNFLRSNEWQHLHLSSIFVEQQHEPARKQRLFSVALLPTKTFVYSMANGSEQEIEGVLLWTKNQRLLFDCRSLRQNELLTNGNLPEGWQNTISSTDILSYSSAQKLKGLLYKNKNDTKQFIGTRRHYEFLLSLYDFAFQQCEYWIMVRQPQLPNFHLLHPAQNSGMKPYLARSFMASAERIHLPTGMSLFRLKPYHFAQLLPLELAYYAEEVIRGRLPNAFAQALEKLCNKRLEQFLQYGIFAGEELIARAMVNTYGLYYWQIGGVYTLPRWRGLGLAHALVQQLCQMIEYSGRIAVLFVRLDNQAALNLYIKNAFECLERMVIAEQR